MKTPSATWAKVEDSIDEAMASLSASDRTAIVLRFFQNQSLREVGAALGTTDDAAQKRVSRAMKISSVSKYLERMADHATNIAEMVIFMAKGKSIRHMKELPPSV